MVVAHNVLAMNANRMLGINTKSKAKSTEKLSSGYRINRAADDAAGLAISEKMRRQIRGLTQGAENCQDGVSFNQIADGAMNEISDMLHRMEELAVKSANGTNSDEDRSFIQMEIAQLNDEIEHITEKTTFNEMPVFGRERNVTEYEINKTGGKDVIYTYSYYVEGNNYGITEVLGQDHIYNGNKLLDPLSFSGNDWVSTGSIKYNGSEIDDILNSIVSYTNNAFTKADIENAMSSGGNSISFLQNSGTSYKIDFKQDGVKNLDGSFLPSSITVSKGTCTDAADESTFTASTSRQYQRNSVSVGSSGLNNGDTYGSAWLDFSGLGKDYSLEDLYGQGFNSTCSHGCEKHYSISFTGSELGKPYEFSGGNQNPVLKVNISNCSTGADIVSSIMNAVNANQSFYNHWQQCAYNKTEPTKLYMYDNSSSYFKSGWSGATFEPVARTTDGKMVIKKTTIHNPSTGRFRDLDDVDLWIQSGTEEKDGFYIKRANISSNILGTNTVNVSTAEGAQNAIETVKNANQIVSRERAMVGAQQNRLEHTIKNLDNIVENTTAAESRIRDTDMAKEMVAFSNLNVLEQAGQSMLTQANQSKQGVLSILQ